VHLGVDLQVPAGTAVRAPLAGVVHSFARNEHALDYGPAVVLRHDLAAGAVAYTLYGHLTLSSLVTPAGTWRLAVGQPLAAGDTVGWVGGAHVNGGWPPHLHLQLNTECGHGGWVGDYPGVCTRADWPAYRALCPDPNVLLRCAAAGPIDGASQRPVL
jgi:murein DD-endopeptidase MepM/ murein hydrolase activator NlpD